MVIETVQEWPPFRRLAGYFQEDADGAPRLGDGVGKDYSVGDGGAAPFQQSGQSITVEAPVTSARDYRHNCLALKEQDAVSVEQGEDGATWVV